MDDAGDLPEESALWRFSNAFYALPGASEALIALQDQHGLDVNVMLFALWLGISGRGLIGGDVLIAADRATRVIRTEIVEPLRALRRRLAHHPDADVQRLREGVKALELAGERLAQSRLAQFSLARIAQPSGRAVSRAARLATARANFALCVGPRTAAGAAAAVIRELLEAFAPDD